MLIPLLAKFASEISYEEIELSRRITEISNNIAHRRNLDDHGLYFELTRGKILIRSTSLEVIVETSYDFINLKQLDDILKILLIDNNFSVDLKIDEDIPSMIISDCY